MSPKFDSAQAIARPEEVNSRPLRIVDAPPHYRAEVQFWNGENAPEPHSLHQTLPYPDSFHPELASFLISKYSKKGDVILDPFCGGGTAGLEANMLGRIAFQSDINPVGTILTQGKLSPADLAEVTLGLQGLQLNRPVEMGPFADVFQYFYSVETFRELATLRTILSHRTDRVSNFLKLIALSLLHGPSAGFFSVYTSPQVALSPLEQKEINHKRRQIPDYRAVMPRILRKTASVLRDGIPSVMRQVAAQNRIEVSDARNLSYVPSSSVGLVVTGPPLPRIESGLSDLWLKLWFLGVPAESIANSIWTGTDPVQWIQYINETCFELARVVRGGGRAAFVLNDVRLGRSVAELDVEIVNMIGTDLSRLWSVECVLVHKPKAPAIAGSIRNRAIEGVVTDTKIVILRRK